MATSKIGILIETLYKGRGAKAAVKDLDGIDAAAKKSTSKMDMLSKGFGQVAVAAGAVGAALVVAKKGFDFAKEGAQLTKVTDTFDALNTSIDTTAETMLGKLRRATQGMVSDIELMMSANRFLSMGLATTADEAANLAEVAIKLGGAMGKGPSAAMEEFALLLSNMSIPRLDTFGISASNVRTKIKDLQASFPGMTREMAFMEAVTSEAAIAMEKLADVDIADPFTKAEVKVKNFTDKLKIAVAEGVLPLLDALDREAEWSTAALALRDFGEATDIADVSIQGLIDDLANLPNKTRTTVEALRLLKEGIALTTVEAEYFAQAIVAADIRAEHMTEILGEHYGVVEDGTDVYEDAIQAINDFGTTGVRAFNALSRAATDLEDLPGTQAIIDDLVAMREAAEGPFAIEITGIEEAMSQLRPLHATLADVFDSFIRGEGAAEDWGAAMEEAINKAAKEQKLAYLVDLIERGVISTEQAWSMWDRFNESLAATPTIDPDLHQPVTDLKDAAQEYTGGSPYNASFTAHGLDALQTKINNLLALLLRLGGTRPGTDYDDYSPWDYDDPADPADTPGGGPPTPPPPPPPPGAASPTQWPAAPTQWPAAPTVNQSNVFNNITSPGWVAQQVGRNTAEAWGNAMRG
jgi:hypothetical protein